MKMKKTTLLCMVLGLAFVSCSLFGPKTGDLEGFEIYFSTDPANMKTIGNSRSAQFASTKDVVHFPKNGALGFTKFWFPYEDAYDVLKGKGTLIEGIMPLEAGHLAGLSFYKAIDRSKDDPLILDAASGTPYVPDIDLPYGMTYKGYIIEYAFLQIEMEDYKLRYYTQDSNKDNKGYKAGDVLIDLNSDDKSWQFIYNKRVLTFDYNCKDHQSPQNNYERIENIGCDLRILLTDQRLPAGMYYENWKYQGVQWDNNAKYIYDFLGKNDDTRLTEYNSDLSKIYEDQKLTQIFRITPDVPTDSGGSSFEAEMGEDTYSRTADNGHGPSRKPTLIIGYGNSINIEAPYMLETFPEDANEAKKYKLELVYSLGNSDHGTDGLHIGVPVDGWNEANTPSASWSELEAFRNYLSIGPTCGGIGARFGWLDFEDVWQGDFSAEAGS